METQLTPTISSLGKDLLKSSSRQVAIVLARPFVFLFLYILCSIAGYPLLGVPFLLALFIANMCAAHDVVHNALGMKRKHSDGFLSAFGLLVMQSGHAFRVTHLSHHALFPSPEDIEGEASRGTFWQSILLGPLYVPRLWIWAYKRMHRYPAERKWMVLEAIAAFVIYLAAFALLPISSSLLIYVVIMTLGAWLYPLVTAYFPHHHAGEDELHQARTMHGKLLPWLLLGLNYHLEHHLYPQVPAHNLGKLSQRLLPILESSKADIIQVP